MAKRKFVSLPTIKSFEIINYPLFKSDWKYHIYNGINLLLGINAIGKTTTTNILAYGLVGNHKKFTEDLDPDYFMQRIENSEEFLKNSKVEPQIAIDLMIGDNSVSFSRSLSEDKILRLSLNKKAIPDHDELTEQYTENIKSLTGLTTLEDLSFLIDYLLVREEEGNYLLWDEGAQSRVLRLLLHDGGFADEFKELEDKLQDADSNYKREKDFMGRLEKRKRDLEEDRKTQLSENKQFLKKEDLIKTIDEFKEKRQKATAERDNLFLVSTQASNNLKSVQNTLSSLRASYDENSDELKALESKFYSGTFSDPKSEFIFSKIANRSICLVCNNHVTEKKVAEVVKKVNKHHECPICSSALSNVNEEVQSLTDREVKRMESLDKLVKGANPDIKRLEKEAANLLDTVEITNQKIISLDSELTELNVQIALNTSKLNQLLESTGTPVSNFDFAIAELQKQIEAYKETTEPLLAKYNRIKKQMQGKNDDLNQQIARFNSSLIEIFSGLAKRYFGESCSLVQSEKKPRGFEFALSYFIPTLQGKERNHHARVSKSQAIFLEYLFRLSVLKLYFDSTGVKPFIFLETSEGSFDVSNTSLMAETLTQVGKMAFPFVVVTNLSKVDFIINLLPDVQERRKRTFNLLTVAPDSVLELRNKTALSNALKQLDLK